MPRHALGSIIAVLAMSPLIHACDSGGDGGTAPPPPASVTVSFSTAAPTISQGDTISVVATASNGGSVTYTSSNSAIASVSNSGVVTGAGAGSATITATSGAATATLEVTVDALTPSVVIDQITQNDQPIDASDVSGTITVELSATVPNTFDGEIVILLGELEVATIPLNGGTAGSGLVAALDEGYGAGQLQQAGEVMVTGIRREVSTAAISVSPVSTIPNGPADLTAALRTLSGVTVGNPAAGHPLTLNNPMGVYINPAGVTVLDAGGTEWVGLRSIEAIVINPGGDARIPRQVDVVAVDIVNGQKSTVYGPDAVGGVITMVMRTDQPFGSGPMAFGGVESQIEWRTPTLTFTDNSKVQLHLYNQELSSVPGFSGPTSWIDTKVPDYGLAPTWSFPSGVNRWLGPNVDLTGLLQANGGDWTQGAFLDNGSGFDTCTDILAGADVQSLAAVFNSDELPETTALNYRLGLRCNDLTLNAGEYLVEDFFGVDRTSPTASLLAGQGFLSANSVNPPTGLDIGFTGADNQSGWDASALLIGGSRQDANGFSTVVGTDNGSGAITAEQVSLSVPGRYTPDYSQTGLYAYDFAAVDLSWNVSTPIRLTVITDPEPPVVSNFTATSFATPGQPVTVSANITDNLGIKNWTVTAQYAPDIRLGMGRGLAWQPGGALVQSDNPNGAFPATGTVEVWNSAVSGPQTPVAASGVWLGARDVADQGHEVWVPATGGGSTASFGANGTDFLDYNMGGPIVDISPTGSSGTPAAITATIQSFTAGGGSSRLAQVGLLAGVPEPGNPSLVAWWPISSFEEFLTTDRGSFFEQIANPVIDATNPAFALEPGVYDVRVGGTDGSGNWLLSVASQKIRVLPD